MTAGGDGFLTEEEAKLIGRGGERIADADLTPEEARLLAESGTSAGAGEPRGSAFILPAEVWTFSTTLRVIRAAALCRQVSPDVVLHAVLAIVASLLDHWSSLETGKSKSVLCYYLLAVGVSGAGKTEALSCARELLNTWIRERTAITGGDGYIDLPLGSGEGLIESFMGTIAVPIRDEATGEQLLDKKGQPLTKDLRKQIRHNALFHTDEGRMVLAVDARKGATIMSVLCEMWSGSVAGQTNAEMTRTRKIEAGSYVVGVLLGFQPATIDDLFADTAGGAPQRFAFADAEHPDITADEVEWPGGLALEVPCEPLDLTLPPHLRRRVREHQAARARGEGDHSALDGHKMLQHCRTAALLALLHGTQVVDDQYWDLAGVLVETSCKLRDHLAGRVEREAIEAARRREAATVRTGVTTAVKVAEATKVRRAADRIVRAVDDAGGELSLGRAKHALRTEARYLAEEAVAVAVADGRLTTEERDGASSGGRRRVTILQLRTEGEEGQ